MTQIVITIENNKWLTSILESVKKLKGVLKLEIVNTDKEAKENCTLDDVWNKWKEDSSDDLMETIYSSRKSNMYPLDL